MAVLNMNIEQARTIVAQSQLEADCLLQKVRRKAADRQQQAACRGQKKGRTAVNSFRTQIRAIETQARSEFQTELVNIAFLAAEELLLSKALNDDAASAVAAVVVHSVRDAQQVKLRVNPLDISTVEGIKVELVAMLRHAIAIDIKIDAQVARGGVICQTESGIIDARIHTQLEELAKNIR